MQNRNAPSHFAPILWGPTVDDAIVFEAVAVWREGSASFAAEDHADFAAAKDLVVADDVVSVTVPNRDAVAVVVDDSIVLRQPVLHSPTEEQPQLIALETVPAHQRTLRA